MVVAFGAFNLQTEENPRRRRGHFLGFQFKSRVKESRAVGFRTGGCNQIRHDAIERKYGLGRGRTDLLIIWPHPASVQRVVMETKLRHGKSLKTVMKEGVSQTWAYMDKCLADAGHLIIFDRAPKRSWDEKISHTTKTHNETTIDVWGA